MATMKLNGAGTYAAFASADLTTKMHYFAKIGTDGLIALAGAGEKALGTIFEPGNALASPTTVQVDGHGKVICGATIVAGSEVEVGTGGKAVTLASGKRVGVALNGGLVNEIIEIAIV